MFGVSWDADGVFVKGRYPLFAVQLRFGVLFDVPFARFQILKMRTNALEAIYNRESRTR